MPLIYPATAATYIDLDDFPLHCAAWETRNPLELLKGAAVRGSNRLIPGAAGVLTKPKRSTETTHTLNMIVRGDVDGDGNPHPTVAEGLVANLLDIRTNATDVDGVTVSRTATLHLPDATTMAGEVQVTLFDWDDSTSAAGFVLATMDILIPLGALA